MRNKQPISACLIFLIAILLSCGKGDMESLPLAPDGSEPIPVSSLSFSDGNLQSCVSEHWGHWVHDVTELNCGSRGIVDISGITSLTYLESLELSNNSITDLTGISPLNYLKTLDLSYNTLDGVDISQLSTITTLKSLTISGSSTVDDVAGLGTLTNLGYLDLSNQILVDGDLSAMSTLVNLESLNLSGNSIMNTATQVATMAGFFPNLTSLNIGYNTGFTNGDEILTWLANNRSGLTSLGMASCSITDTSVDILSSLINLTHLEIGNNAFTYGAAFNGYLSSLSKLSELDISSSGITDISIFSSFSNLSQLNLSSNNVTSASIATLSSASNLQDLDLYFNSVSINSTDLNTALSPLSKLRRLNLGQNTFSDTANIMTVISGKTALEYLYLDNSTPSLSDVSVLSALTNLKEMSLNTSGVTTGVNNLQSLKNAYNIDLAGNGVGYCTDVDTLRSALGSSVVLSDCP